MSSFLQPQAGDHDFVDFAQTQQQTDREGGASGTLVNNRPFGRKADGTPVAFPEDKQALYQQMIKQLVFDGHADAAEAMVHSTGVMVPRVHEDGNRLQQMVALGEASASSRKETLSVDQSQHVVEHLLDQSVYMNEGADPLVTPTMVERFTTDSLTSPQRSTCWSADGQFLACGGTNGIVRVFSLPAMGQAHKLNSKPVQHVGEPSAFETHWSLAREISNHQMGVEWMRFHPVERTKLCTGGRDGKLHLMDLATPDCVRTELRLGEKKFQDTFPIRCGAFHPSGRFLLYGTDHETVRLYDVERGEIFSAGGVSSVRHTAAVADVAFAPDGGVFASCSYDGALNLYETTSGRGTFSNPKAHGSVPVTSISFSRSSNVLLTGGMDSQVRLWDLRKLNVEVACFGSPTKTEHRIRAQFDFSEKRIVTIDSTIKNVKVIDIFSGQVVAGLLHQQEQRTFSVSPTELMIATCGDDSRMRVWGTTL